MGQLYPELICLPTRDSLCERFNGLPESYATVKLVNGKTFALSGSIGSKDR